MRKSLLVKAFCFFNLSLFNFNADAQVTVPDTVRVGIYITSIHDIDFKEKEYTANLWLWLKLQCVMKDSWRIENFPFDRQNLRLFIENSQYDLRSLVFEADTVGNHYDNRFTLRGWIIDSCLINTGVKVYETAFGDEEFAKPRSEYSSFRTRLVIKRDASGLFWKMFLGMYIAFLIAYVCFFIHSDGMDSRFGLSVGSIFAVIGNKYIIDSALPESSSFTLVDTLHGVTLFFIFATIAANAYSLKLIKRNKIEKAYKFDLLCAAVMLVFYLALNGWFIWKASKG